MDTTMLKMGILAMLALSTLILMGTLPLKSHAEDLMPPTVTGIQRIDANTIELSGDVNPGSTVVITGGRETATATTTDNRDWRARVDISDDNNENTANNLNQNGWIDLSIAAVNPFGQSSETTRLNVNTNADLSFDLDREINNNTDQNNDQNNSDQGVFATVIPGTVF